MSPSSHVPEAAPSQSVFHSLTIEEVFAALGVSHHGLDLDEAARRLEHHGRNELPRAEPPGMLVVFFRQFLSPLIYVLLIAAGISLLLEEWSDAGFIFGVLLINAVIGSIQEYSAERSAAALQQLVSAEARVLRAGDTYEVDARDLVPGDIVLLESGDKLPADLRLFSAQGMQVDESLLTGESLAVSKDPQRQVEAEAVLGERLNMAFAGTLLVRGHGRGLVVATGLQTELGRIAEAVLYRPVAKPPLLIRMERFTKRIALLVMGAVLLMAVVSVMRGSTLTEIFFLSVALAVSAIPEGLPVALTVALAIGMRRMARRNVIIRKLVAVEALGSCTLIASDKTGTLTVNELTVRRLAIPQESLWEMTGEGAALDGVLLTPEGTPTPQQVALAQRLCQAAVLTNDAFLGHRDGAWVHHGDPVDVALLVLAHKLGISRAQTLDTYPELASLAFESERRYSASCNRVEGEPRVFVKGALEALLPMCERMACQAGECPLDAVHLTEQARELAEQGYRVLALVSGRAESCEPTDELGESKLKGLVFLGLVGMIDPLRSEAKAAVAACRDAGVMVSMVTGDHPGTALAVARELDLAASAGQVVSGTQLREAEAEGTTVLDRLTGGARVFARVEPQQKLDIVQSLQRQGHFVAVTGDGANDAPALRVAHVGVAMGCKGTDVARETADIIITDDHFASIVAGIEEGRVAYANVRKVIFLLISTGAAELVLFALSLFSGLPLPLLAVQLLWLNLVTNGIQDVALAFEPAEGDELRHPPRAPSEPVFNRLMVERVVLSALAIGSVVYLAFGWLLGLGYSLDEARNGALLLMVLFENVHVFNSRSETLSAFAHNPLRNRLLLFGTLIAQLIHIGAMYTPGFNTVLGIQPVSLDLWASLLGMALSVLVVMELHKLSWKYRKG